MKVPTPLALIGVALLGAAAGSFLSTKLQSPASPAVAPAVAPAGSPGSEATATRPTGSRKILFYQSAMHPWIKSDRPGNCTICGMKLTPVFEGDQGIATNPGMVTLSSNAITTLNVATLGITRGPLIRTLRVAGTIEDDDTRHRFISAYVGGRLEELHVNYVGTEVRAGQPLARFYSPMLLEAERQYLALHDTALLPVSNTAGPTAGDAADHMLLRESAAERLRQLGLTAEQIAALPGKTASNHFTEILSPVSGTVLNRFVYAGQNVMEGEKLFEIADFNTMWFRFDVYEQDLPWIAVGQEVEITAPSLPGQSLKAPVQFIEPSLVDMTRSAKVRVEIPNPLLPGPASAGDTSAPGSAPRRLLRHRLYAEGRVQVNHPDVLLVPRSAVLSPDGNPVVYVDRSGGAYERRPVRLGRVGDQHFEVLEGLTVDDRVVTSGNLLIDAQAQLNLSVQGSVPTPPKTTTAESKPASLPSLLGPQEDALMKFLTSVDTLRGHLAWDDLAGFNTASAQLTGVVQQLSGAFPSAGTSASPGWQSAIHHLSVASGIRTASDLRSARKAFHTLSASSVELVKSLRAGDSSNRFREIRIYQCPMTAEAFDGAPARAQWLQMAPPLRNPWFGKEMLECGVEVAP